MTKLIREEHLAAIEVFSSQTSEDGFTLALGGNRPWSDLGMGNSPEISAYPMSQDLWGTDLRLIYRES
ncbi:MAG: hypothetical protein AAGA48_40515 [Myxococcota bacterium]